LRVIRDVGLILVTEIQETASQQGLCIQWIRYSKAYARLQPVSIRGWLSSKRDVLILHGLFDYSWWAKHSQAAYNRLWSHPRWPAKAIPMILEKGVCWNSETP
jgi:hypothetical protein